ncbi:MAG TPA: aromatic amino acid transport family protein, partial [Candidatus Paceibacterota bacterium]|nr:aromatic amino acid transport family protein [Candidatus Paceibacterota bacterium]
MSALFAAFRDRAFRHAAAVLVGTMVGVGIFGIPYAFARSGFLIGTAWLVGIAAVSALFGLMFTELMLRTPGEHRQLAGYAEFWLGAWGRRLITFCNVLGIYGALLAYTIVIGPYLHNVLSQFFAIDPQFYSILFTMAAAPVILFRLRTVAAVETALTVLFVLIMLFIAVAGAPHISAENYLSVNHASWFLPYGVLLFAFAGMTSMPIMRRLLSGREAQVGPAVLWAVGVVAVLYLAFAAVVVGISGPVTSPDALSGLFEFVGLPIVIVGSLLGILTIATSYIMLGTAMMEIFNLDYRFRLPSSWLLSVVPPFLLFFSGLRNFIDVIATVGAVAIGLQSVVFIRAYLLSRRSAGREPELVLGIPAAVWYVLMAAFAAGVGYALIWH